MSNARFTYKGWRITYERFAPVTGRWRAERFGVGMCNNSRESILRMVDQRVAEEQPKKEQV